MQTYTKTKSNDLQNIPRLIACTLKNLIVWIQASILFDPVNACTVLIVTYYEVQTPNTNFTGRTNKTVKLHVGCVFTGYNMTSKHGVLM